MEVKTMRVVVQKVMLLLIVELAVGQPAIINTPQIPQTPPAGGVVIPPSDAIVTNPPDEVIFPPAMPGEVLLPPLLPSDPYGFGLIAPYIPGFDGLDLPKKKCLGRCNVMCRRKKVSPFARDYCPNACSFSCGIRMSNVVFSCTSNCVLSTSPNSISDAEEPKKVHVDEWDSVFNVWKVPEMVSTRSFKVKEEFDGKEGWGRGHREASVLRYKEKRQNRLFSKRIRYEVRRLNAEKRPRLKV
ncbi:hypothetical protein PTKIN_Ptkin08bG0021100 [Pterospermum kingtungense]